ncbi:hypothetical protein SARC_05095 [Sphaeroforma arctica JP610]|uniref:Uncharacterized protein n=1 Tax=Sphaeroforma arctica JP610 TaxID=667725 RepID=A0A0L0G1F5_9EUKA|nr:hypothetical protein SARC_05095 [Sphaeroforma arctica JP610]KNC82621.1 hypothetical protein SARC_05095 [Sphaeroforma arctica JP610]|eukprot:XP_014156523.1 hypothetical protein SARC_05095 [Sphaeroforma arctica JP610]
MFSALSGSISTIYNEVREEVTAAGSTRNFIGGLREQLREDASELTTQLQEDVTVFLAPRASPSNTQVLQTEYEEEDTMPRRYTQPRPKARQKNGGYFKDLRHTLETQKSIPDSINRRGSYTQTAKTVRESHGPRGSFDDLTSVYKSEDEIEAVHMELVHTGAHFLPEEIIAANIYRKSQMSSDNLISTIEEHAELAPTISIDGMVPAEVSEILSPAPKIKLKKKRVVRRMASPADMMMRSHSSNDLVKHRLSRNESSESFSVSRSPHMSTDSLNSDNASRGPQPRLSTGKVKARKKVSLSVGGALNSIGTDPLRRKGSGPKKALQAPMELRSDSRVGLNQDTIFGGKQVKKDLELAEQQAQDALENELKLMEEENREKKKRESAAKRDSSTKSATAKVSGFLDRLVRSRSGSGSDEQTNGKGKSEENLETSNVIRAINEEIHDSAFQESGDEHVQVPKIKHVSNRNGTNTVPMSVFS